MLFDINDTSLDIDLSKLPGARGTKKSGIYGPVLHSTPCQESILSRSQAVQVAQPMIQKVSASPYCAAVAAAAADTSTKVECYKQPSVSQVTVSCRRWRPVSCGTNCSPCYCIYWLPCLQCCIRQDYLFPAP